MNARTEPAVHVYCGPTITPAEVLGIIPGASVHPPVQHGDVLRLAVSPGDTVIIIDGVFHAVAAVRHKEILDLLARGVRVVGAASMGALRAAELYPYGMTGVGAIFAAYRDGIIDADDEVAVAHTDDCRQSSEPLADIRALVAAAVADGFLDHQEAERVIGHVRSVPYPERTWPAFRKATADPEIGALLERLDTWRAARGPAEGAKHADAVAALRLVADGGPPPAPDGWVSGPWSTFYLRDWISRHRGSVVDGVHVPYLAVLQHQQIYDRGFPARWRRHVLSWIAAALTPDSQDDGSSAEDRALAAAQTRGFAIRYLSPAQLAYWLTGNEIARLADAEKLARILVRSMSRSRSAGIWPVAPDDAPGLLSPAIDSAGAAAAAYCRADQIANSAPGRTIYDLRTDALRGHLGGLWETDPEDEPALTAAARDRGFVEISEAVEAARLFFLSAGPVPAAPGS
jgi:hypothetical protein